MEKKLTIVERILSDTPLFFKKLQILGLGLASAGTALAQVQTLPSKITAAIISIGTTIVIIAQFAVKQYDTNAK